MEIFQDVRARGTRWRVTELREFEDCRMVTLAATEPAAHGRSCRLLAPFDDIVPIVANDRPRHVGLRRWRRACRALLASDAPPGTLRRAALAQIDLLPHQLEPALSILRGLGSRVLLADDVGLGKTIQAGLILVELIERRAVERALILTPAGLRDQWIDELRGRFDLQIDRADSRMLRERAAALPLGQNPWTTMPLAIGSLDYVKRPEVLPAVASCAWDALIVDEAHTAVGDSDRSAAVRLLASRAAFVVLLTATPHSGDAPAFDALCAFGAATDVDRLIVFRRTRQAIRGDLTRRVHTLRVRPSALERHMHAALEQYRRAVLAEHGSSVLAIAVLDKRALSSPWALAQSVDRRLQALAGTEADDECQLTLPLFQSDGESDADDAPPAWPEELALSDLAEERRLLSALAAAARDASRSESKVLCVRRLLRRARESAVVFTEYRDTAERVRTLLGAAFILHGGLNRTERAAVLDAFVRAERSILVATDAAGQGLNLHHSCRLVVNLELPWNPMRLEQRIGRVDRIGQRRRVHALHLVAAGTREEEIFERLRTRIARARDAIDAADPIESHTRPCAGTVTRQDFVVPDLGADAQREAARAARQRALISDRDRNVLSQLEGSKWWMNRVRRGRLRALLAGQAILIFRFSSFNTAGRHVASRLVPVAAPSRVAESIDATALAPLFEHWKAVAAQAEESFWAQRSARARAIDLPGPQEADALFQPALFDRRAERLRDERQSAVERLNEAASRAIADAALQSAVRQHVCELLLVLLP